ncbi:PilN domain-containing protein [Psychroserpens damuponensis]|uniref:PilN domain-containing protein n=1 Tax=Psychroserpens damuponensis TaxID=943936 RepID=UPI00058E9ED7|nr:PilN domain-containing protein [Psychroserpens damuponensis]
MKDKLISYLTYGNSYYSVEQTQANGSTIYCGIGLKKSKNQVEVEDRFECHNLDEVSKHIPKGKAVCLVVNNEFTITKKVESVDAEILKLIHQAFPNIKIDDFYYEILKQDTIHFVSICRKDYLDELLKEYLSHNISIVDFSLGNLMISSIAHLISEISIQTSNATMIKEGNQIISIEATEDLITSSYAFNDTNLTTKELLTFSSALSLVTNTKQTVSAFRNRDKGLLANFKEKRFFTQFTKIGLCVLFSALLINFFLFSNYYGKANELRETAQLLEASKSNVVNLSNKVKKSQKLVEDVLKTNSSRSSFYADALIKYIPESIVLTQLNYQPLLRKIKADKPIDNDTNTIMVSGTSQERIVVSEWISSLEKLNWIQNIEILNFDDTKNSSSSFSFKIYIQDETKN